MEIGIGPQQLKIILILKSKKTPMTIREIAKEIHGRPIEVKSNEYCSVACSLKVMEKKFGLVQRQLKQETPKEIQWKLTARGKTA